MILAIETSSQRGSVAVLANGALLFNETFTAERGHSAGLFLSLERAYRLFTMPERIVVGLGPGSYSGIRIAIAAAAGLAAGSSGSIDLIGIPSVNAVQAEPGEYLVIGDARRAAFYYSRIRDGACLEGPMLLDEAELRGRLDALPLLPVHGVAPMPGFDRLEIRYPSAAILATLAERNIGISASGVLEPIYLREPHITKPKS